MSAQKKVEQHLNSGKSITQLQCLNLFGNMRLAVIIERARKKGMEIKTEITEGKNRFEEKTNFATYKLA